MKKNIIIIVIILIAILIALFVYKNKAPVETIEPPVVTQELTTSKSGAIITISVDDIIKMDGTILFALDSADLSSDGKAMLDERIAKYRARTTKNLDIDIIGYTDDTGSKEYNLTLSLKRANAVASYIDLQTDIPHNTITVQGVGEELSAGSSKESNKMDRRVTIHVTGTLIDDK